MLVNKFPLVGQSWLITLMGQFLTLLRQDQNCKILRKNKTETTSILAKFWFAVAAHADFFFAEMIRIPGRLSGQETTASWEGV